MLLMMISVRSGFWHPYPSQHRLLQDERHRPGGFCLRPPPKFNPPAPKGCAPCVLGFGGEEGRELDVVHALRSDYPAQVKPRARRGEASWVPRATVRPYSAGGGLQP